MLVLEVSVNVGAGATPLQLEALVRAVRVATDVGRDTELRRVRRTALDQLRFPTDGELRDAMERLPDGDETGPRYRARRQLDARDLFFEEGMRLLPEIWWELRHRQRRTYDRRLSALSDAGYDRLAGVDGPWLAGSSVGLDVLDPILYQALVADRVARSAPGEIEVRRLTYSNPFGEELAAAGAAAEALSKAAGVIDTAATLGSRRKIKKVEAEVAEASAEDEINVRRERARRARLENDLLEEELLARRIQNAQTLLALGAQRSQQALVAHATALGQLDQADAIAAADPTDAAALVEFALRPPQLESHHEPDPDERE